MEHLVLYLKNYLNRHKNAVNLILHIIGIPMAVSGFILMFSNFIKGSAFFLAGYVLQWIGHVHFEKNELGEWTLIKNIVIRIFPKKDLL